MKSRLSFLCWISLILQVQNIRACRVTVTNLTFKFDAHKDTIIQGIESLALCEEECVNDKSCEAYTFEQNNSTCLKFSALRSDEIPCENGKCTTGTVNRIQSGTGCQNQVEDFIRVEEAETSEECLLRCMNDAFCKNFVFFNKQAVLRNSCHLYSSECKSVSKCSDCESGSLTCLYSRSNHCDEYLLLDDSSRSVSSGLQNDRDRVGTSHKSPDWRGTTWYKFGGKAGKFLPETSPGPNHCGTWGSGYLTTPHPTRLYETIKAQVCFDLTGYPSRDDCYKPTKITITNCGDNDFVYGLQEVNENYFLRYCGTDQPPQL